MNEDRQKIKILPPVEAMRIAAGEVIDRPCALVREFLDNAIDAHSLNIDVSIEEGGCKKVEVSDDGSGMSREDLEMCHLTHATSKIRGLDDLETSRTLGFRGEALAAACAVSRLEVITSTDGREAFCLISGPGENHAAKIEQTRRTKGTTVRALNLFESIPARKRFLKREGSEAALDRQIFFDKALAFNTISFRYLQDGRLKDFLPAVQSKKERFASALFQAEKNFLHEINTTGEGFSAAIVIGGAELYRSDRRQIFIFANGRRVNDYSLIQAVEYGSQGWFPNGAHPVAAVFIEIDPSLADFNIHPAKREVRFRDPSAIHRAVSGSVKSFFHTKTVAGFAYKNIENNSVVYNKSPDDTNENTNEVREKDFSFSYNDSVNDSVRQSVRTSDNFFKSNINKLSELIKNNSDAFSKPRDHNEDSYEKMRYAGRVFGLFILIEWGDKLYIIDQHAAHERILYDKFLEEGIPKQELLVSVTFSAESDEEDSFLESKSEEFSRLGIDLKREGSLWRIEALPADWRMSDAQTVKEILELRSAGENIAQRWAATVCCRCAIKDGDYPDDETAFALGRQALSLAQPRCPHGRPIWTEISRDALYKAVRRE